MSINFSMDDFEDCLNESTPFIVAGMKFYQGTILRKCDPVAFHQAYHDYCAAVEEEIEREDQE